jgi:hypothetical protein
MCNKFTNEHFWIVSSNTSNSAPYVGQPCQCGSVLWKADQQALAAASGETDPRDV